MSQRRPLRLALFMLDTLRLGALVGAMVAVRTASQGAAGGTLATHSVALASPQALFPLLALFFMLDPVKYQDFVPLYVTGKLISAIALTTWLSASIADTRVAMELADGALLVLGIVGAVSALWDFVSAALAFFLLRNRPVPLNEAYAPDLVVDSVDAEPGDA